MSDVESDLTPDATPNTDRRGTPKKRRKLSNKPSAVAARRRRREGATKPAKDRKRSLEAPLREMLYAIGGVWGTTEAFRDHPEPTCGEVLQDQAGAIAKALNVVAQDDPSVYLWLDRMMTGGGWGSVAFAVLPVAQAFAGNHVIPAIQRRAGARMVGPWEEVEPIVEPVDVEPEYGAVVETPEPVDLGEAPEQPPVDPRPERPA